MQQSPFSEANSSENSQEIPRIMEPEDIFPQSHELAIFSVYQAISSHSMSPHPVS